MHRSPNNKFDQKVKKTLENARVEPPAFLWNTIESKLPSNKSWYRKYKYLLLLLLLSATSSTGIFIYKNIILRNDTNTIILNKRLLKDEIAAQHVTQPISNKKNDVTAKNRTDAERLNNSAINDKPSVASFYDKNKNGNPTVESLIAQKYAEEKAKQHLRFKRLQVELQSNQEKEKVQNNNSSIALFTSLENLKPESQFKNNSTDEYIANNNEEITTPISEPIRRKENEPLTASVVPVKVQQSPLPSRDVLRSMIEPGKLETLDVKDQAIGINDMNPNKEKMLKNLKQFSGYDINKGFHFGAFICINNIWLNKKQFSADENTTSIKPKMQFGNSYGINIGYDYTDRWGIQVEWQISEQGQKYSMTQPAHSDHICVKDINLLYTKFPLMLKYRQTFINKYNSKPVALNFLFGPQIGFLIKKRAQLDGEELRVSSLPEYNKVEFGILGGFDFDLYMTRNVVFTIGGRTGFASSMRRGQPMSFQLGVTTQFNFRFPKKIK